MSVSEYIRNYGGEGKIAPGNRIQEDTVRLAGRIHNIRQSGQKLRFYDLHGEGQKVQIMAQAQCGLSFFHNCYTDPHTEMPPLLRLSSNRIRISNVATSLV